MNDGRTPLGTLRRISVGFPQVDELTLRTLLDRVETGELAVMDALREMRRLPFNDLGFAKVDHHRALRQGLAEVVYGPGKTPQQCALIVNDLLSERQDSPVILSRADRGQVRAALDSNPGGDAVPLSEQAGAVKLDEVDLREDARLATRGLGLTDMFTVVWRRARSRPGAVTIVTAGTADLPVARESMTVLSAHGVDAVLIPDCGVAGVHRLVASMDELTRADAVIVVAGMEGALASVVAGLVSVPVIAVPTSVGYGASLEGVTALLAMLSCCVPGVTVVGIDNGFGAACALIRIMATSWGGNDRKASASPWL